MLKDVIGKDSEAVERATRHEHTIAKHKRPLVFGLLREAQQHVKHVEAMQKSVTSQSK